MKSATIAIVTVTYNSERDLAKNWADADVEDDVNWISVDNASGDDSAALAREMGARVIELPRNVGFSAANNVGAAQANVDCLVFVNPDVRVTRVGVRELVDIAMERNAVVAPQLINPDESLQENGRSAPFLYRKVAHFLGTKVSRDQYEITAGPGELKEVSWVIGAALVIPTAIFRDLCGWDSKFFVYYEDADICLRARTLGYSVLLSGSTRWVHGWGRATRRSFSWRAWRHEVASGLRFYLRYPRLLLHPLVVRDM